ncbi:kinase-like protein [Gonapodya prolifera JEL478]|uniref:Kinase-like protein n=1 Tax=Gonapodya prolifera (strain JEL478) TaxID=1344416 RepID=A0A139A7C3_GONPJ|nr:kinase-like protein [Gonapodya prolifera JEL478]|eukprot:KXS12701.1 kinase-like protein [Gonapodya prolifera JEL478]
MDVIGQGTFGKVVRAWDQVRRCHCAIKIIRSIQKYRDASQIELRVLQHLKRSDPMNTRRCIHLLDTFEHRNHICMVFELLSQSLYDFMKDNQFNPFPLSQVRAFASQLVGAVAYMHTQKLVHTDLKPENMMLHRKDSHCDVIVHPGLQPLNQKFPGQNRKVLLSPEMMLIDFGSATFDGEYHSSVVSTRHYRAPEIILNMGWSYPCDIWSIGCILVELYTGEALFQTHDNLEHLAMMEAILGSFSPRFVASLPAGARKLFTKSARVDFPNDHVSRASRKFVKGLKPLNYTIRPEHSAFLDLVKQMLEYDPTKRLTAQEALKHPFFRETWAPPTGPRYS